MKQSSCAWLLAMSLGSRLVGGFWAPPLTVKQQPSHCALPGSGEILCCCRREVQNRRCFLTEFSSTHTRFNRRNVRPSSPKRTRSRASSCRGN